MPCSPPPPSFPLMLMCSYFLILSTMFCYRGHLPNVPQTGALGAAFAINDPVFPYPDLDMALSPSESQI